MPDANELAIVPLLTSLSDLAQIGELIGDPSTGELFMKLDDGTVVPIKGADFISLLDSLKNGFITYSGDIYYSATNAFDVDGDQTEIFSYNRKLKILDGASYIYSTCSASSYDSGTDSTHVIIADEILSDPIDSLKFSIVKPGMDGSLPIEAIEDLLGEVFIESGDGITITYNDASDEFIIETSEEDIQEIIGNSLVEGSNITLSYDPGSGETTINASNVTDSHIKEVVNNELMDGYIEHNGDVRYKELCKVSSHWGWALALQKDRTLVAWGDDSHNQVSDLPIDSDIIKIGAGWSFGVSMREDGSVDAWGEYDLGSGYVPVAWPSGPYTFIDVACGQNHYVLIDDSNNVVVYGNDEYNQITNAPASGVEVSSGMNFSVVLNSDGSLTAWGQDNYNQVTNCPDSGDVFKKVDCGWNFGLALKDDGSIVGWGDDSYNQITDIPTGIEFIDISCGNTHAGAIDINNNVHVWGQDVGGDFGSTDGAPDATVLECTDGNTIFMHYDGTLQVTGVPSVIESEKPASLISGSNVFEIMGGDYTEFFNLYRRLTITNLDGYSGSSVNTRVYISSSYNSRSNSTFVTVNDMYGYTIDKVYISIISVGSQSNIPIEEIRDIISDYLDGGTDIDITYYSATDKLVIGSSIIDDDIEDIIDTYLVGGANIMLTYLVGTDQLEISVNDTNLDATTLNGRTYHVGSSEPGSFSDGDVWFKTPS